MMTLHPTKDVMNSCLISTVLFCLNKKVAKSGNKR